MRVFAVDPGARSGAWALIDTELHGHALVGDLPIVIDGVNPSGLHALIQNHRPDVAISEAVNAFPGQGARSIWVFGQAYGCIKAVIACSGVPLHLVSPTKWKGHFKLPGKDKEAARSLAIQFYPGVSGLSRKADHNRAEALLLARYHTETGK